MDEIRNVIAYMKYNCLLDQQFGGNDFIILNFNVCL